MTKSVFRSIVFILIGYVLLGLVTPYSKFLKKRSIEHQINYLAEIMSQGKDDNVQERFPEGKLFSNAIFALSIIEYFETNEKTNYKYAAIVDEAIKRILSESALSGFDKTMRPSYGIFYNGWAKYVIKKYKRSSLFEHSTIKKLITHQSAVIEQRIVNEQTDSIHILDSYEGLNWPADNLVGLMAIDDIEIQNKWLDCVLNTKENKSGLIHHAGSQKDVIRGSSQSLIIYCLGELAYEELENYNTKFKQIFLDDYLGVQLVKENEDGSSQIDVDSGPVILGYGASATIMNIKTQASLGDINAKKTWALMNTISLPINLFGMKYYLFKQEPMFDIFMLWGSVGLD